MEAQPRCAMKELIAEQHELACCAINVAEVYAGMRGPEKEKTKHCCTAWNTFRLAGKPQGLPVT